MSLLPEKVQWGMMLGERPVTDLVEARRYVEVGVAELAAERRDERDLNELKDILEKMRKEESAEEFTRLDIAFHERLAQASRNTVFRGLVSNIRVFWESGSSGISRTPAKPCRSTRSIHRSSRRSQPATGQGGAGDGGTPGRGDRAAP